MTQPPPFQGGYPQQNPNDPSGYGQPPQSPAGYGQPPQSPAGYGQPPQSPAGYGQPPQSPSGFPPPGVTPSGFPSPKGTPGAPPPPKRNNKLLGILGSIGLIVVIAVVGIFIRYVVGAGVDNISDNAQDKPSVAEVGDCTTKSANKYTSDASDVVTVNCDAQDAYFKVVKREDDPEGTDGDKAGEKVCTGTTAAEYIYLTSGASLDWVICLDPIDIETAKFGEIPAEKGQCLSDNTDYFELVDCGDPKASIEVLNAEDNPDKSLTNGDQAFNALCDPQSTMYFTSESANNDVGPYDWFLCTTQVQ